MPVIEIPEEAVKLATGEVMPLAAARELPPVSATERAALGTSERYTQPYTLVIMRRIIATDEVAAALRDWFQRTEEILRVSEDQIDHGRARLCAQTAQKIGRAIAFTRRRQASR